MLSNRTRGDDGVVAVLTALLVATVLLPVAGLGLGTYVRAGVAEEMQRAADAGALAAATSLLFVDTDGLDLRADGAKLVTGPACPAAQVSLGGSWTPQREAAPLSAEFAADPDQPVSCQPDFSFDENYPECISHLVANGQAIVDATNEAVMRVLTALDSITPAPVTDVTDPLLGVVTPALPSTATALSNAASRVLNVLTRRVALAQRVFALVPAAQQDGIVVTLDYAVRAPLDGLFGRDGWSTAQATSTSRRLFKPLLPTSEAVASALTEPIAAQDPQLAAVLASTPSGDPVLSPVESQVVQEMQNLLVTTADQLQTAGVALEGVDDEIAEATSSEAQLQSTLRMLHAEIAAAAPEIPAEVLALMLADPAPPVRLNPLNPDCQKAARELVMALGRALQLNEDEDELTSCLTDEVLGLPGAKRPEVPRHCVAGLFRAQLRPDAGDSLLEVIT